MNLRFLQLCLAVLFVSTLGCNGCNDDCYDMTDPDCLNYDFCSTVPDLEADFKIFRNAGTVFLDTQIIVELDIMDTAYYGRINFRALEETDSYLWKIGTDDSDFTDQEFDLHFSTNAIGAIDVTLSVEKDIEDCPEIGTQVAAKTRSFEVIDLPVMLTGDTIPLIGKYLGKNESEPDSSDFLIDFAIGPNNVVHLRGFPRGAVNGEFYNDIRVQSDYKGFLFLPKPISCCQSAYGTGYLSDNKQELRIEYSTLDSENWKWSDHTWVGVRVD